MVLRPCLCDLYDFFRHDNHTFPAALSDGGKLHACQKSQLAAVLESHVTLPDNEPFRLMSSSLMVPH